MCKSSIKEKYAEEEANNAPRGHTTEDGESNSAADPATGFSSVRDQTRPGNTTSGKPTHRTSQIRPKCKGSGHPVVFGTTICELGTLKQKGEKWTTSISTETVSMICKLIESVNCFCILLAITEYMDDLLQKTLTEAQDISGTQVKLTSREEVSCPVIEADDPLADGHLLLDPKKREEEHVHPPLEERPLRDTPCSGQLTSNPGPKSQHTQGEN